VVEPVARPEELAEEWDALAARTGSAFATRSFHGTWWEHYGRRRRRELAAVRRDDGSLAAILPLYRWRERPLQVLRFVGDGVGDELGPICAPGDRVLAAGALREAVSGRLLVGERLPGEGWAAAMGGSLVLREGSPLVQLGQASWDDFLALRSANFRQQLRRRERALFREHDARFRLTSSADELERDFSSLVDLHRGRWHDRTSFLRHEPFHRAFAARALEEGRLRLWHLEVEGSPVAAWLGFRVGRVESFYQAGRDPAWDHASVGLVLLAHSIRAALEDGMDEYRFLRGAEPYKYRFADEDPGLETIVVAPGAPWAAAGLTAGARLLRRTRHRIRLLRATSLRARSSNE
jgi:CelD/BcsL family acetyltransferase involved in cellulose biosynthesis